MELPFIDKHLYLLLTNAEGSRLDPITMSIQDIIFKKDGHYDVTCRAAANESVETGMMRRGSYKIKDSSGGKITLLCDEETGKLKGHYEVSLDLLKSDMGRFRSMTLTDGSAVNGIFKIAA